MTQTSQSTESLALNISQEIHVRAPRDTAFAALLEQVGPYNETPDGKPMPMKIEPWPGGHFPGHVQAIGRPASLEITRPPFVLYPLVSNLRSRLTETDGGMGFMEDHHKAGVKKAWTALLERVRNKSEEKHDGR